MTGSSHVFISYSHQDEHLRDQLITHLAPLRHSGVIVDWTDRDLLGGDDWQRVVSERLQQATLVLLLVSPDFLSSGYCIDVEMKQALEYHTTGQARVVPVILRECDWRQTPLATLHALPAKPVATFPDRDAAWHEVVRGIRRIIDHTSRPKPRRSVQPSFPDEQTRTLSQAMDAARARRQQLIDIGASPSEVDTEILDLRRRLREGGQLRPGDSLQDGRFLLINRLGRGGFATVWEAFDRLHEQHVAIKVLHSEYAEDPNRRERFFRGARVMASLEHDAVVRIIEPVGEDGGYCYFAMELLTGGDFQSAVNERTLDENAVFEIVLQVGAALCVAHDHSYFHRDVKPANILLDENGRAKLTDFDLVAVSDSTGGTRTGALGTFAYTAPEIVDRPQDANAGTDVYSLGMTAIFGLLGGLSFMDIYQRSAMVNRLRCSEQAKLVLEKAISLDSAQRYDSAGVFCHDLKYASLRDRRGQSLAGRVLRAMQFDEADFTRADLSATDLSGSSFKRARLVATRLRGAQLQSADLTEADLTEADLLGADLRGANLRGAILKRANLIGTCFDEAGHATCASEIALSNALLPPRARYRHGPACLSVSFCGDGSRLATSCMGGFVNLWEVASLARVGVKRVSTKAVWQVAMNLQGTRVAAVSWDELVHVWNLHDGSVRTLGKGGWGVAFDSDGSTLASASNDGIVRLWDASTGESLGSLPRMPTVRCVAFSTAPHILAAGCDDGTVRLWNLDEKRLVGMLQPEHDVVTGRRTQVRQKTVGSVYFGDGGEKLLTRAWHTVRSVNFSPDAKTLVASWDNGIIRLYEVTTGSEVVTLRGHRSWIRAVRFGPKDGSLVSASDDQTIRAWDRATTSSRTLSNAHAYDLAFCPSSDILACALEQGVVELIRPGDGAPQATLVCDQHHWAVYASDGRYKISAHDQELLSFAVGDRLFRPGDLDPYLHNMVRLDCDQPMTCEALETQRNDTPQS